MYSALTGGCLWKLIAGKVGAPVGEYRRNKTRHKSQFQKCTNLSIRWSFIEIQMQARQKPFRGFAVTEMEAFPHHQWQDRKHGPPLNAHTHFPPSTDGEKFLSSEPLETCLFPGAIVPPRLSGQHSRLPFCSRGTL